MKHARTFQRLRGTDLTCWSEDTDLCAAERGAGTKLQKAQRNSSCWIRAFPLQSFRLVSPEQALKELGLAEHQLRFTCRVHIQDPRKEHETVLRVYNHLKGQVQPQLCLGFSPRLSTGSTSAPSFLALQTSPTGLLRGNSLQPGRHHCSGSRSVQPRYPEQWLHRRSRGW